MASLWLRSVAVDTDHTELWLSSCFTHIKGMGMTVMDKNGSEKSLYYRDLQEDGYIFVQGFRYRSLDRKA